MKSIFNQIWSNISYCLDLSIKYTGIIFTLWSIVAIFVPFDNLLADDIPWHFKLIIALLIVLFTFLIIFLISTVIALNLNSIELLDVGNNHHVYVQYGDIFSPDIIKKKTNSNKRNIVIPVNRCFDTIVDDDLISSCSLHGKAMKKLYADGLFSIETLDKEIQKKLKNESYDTIIKKNKPRGNLKRYSEGTVAEITGSDGVTYFFVGLTSFDKNLHPYITDVEYITALIKTLTYCLKRNQGYPVIIPLIGGGRANTGKNEKDILEYLVKLIKIHSSSINCDIHIVVRQSAKDTISIINLN